MQSACTAEMAFCGTRPENVAYGEENEGHLPSQASVFWPRIATRELAIVRFHLQCQAEIGSRHF
jgi:hypothetical protein